MRVCVMYVHGYLGLAAVCNDVAVCWDVRVNVEFSELDHTNIYYVYSGAYTTYDVYRKITDHDILSHALHTSFWPYLNYSCSGRHLAKSDDCCMQEHGTHARSPAHTYLQAEVAALSLL